MGVVDLFAFVVDMHHFYEKGLTGSHNGHQIRTDFILTKKANPGDRLAQHHKYEVNNYLTTDSLCTLRL